VPIASRSVAVDDKEVGKRRSPVGAWNWDRAATTLVRWTRFCALASVAIAACIGLSYAVAYAAGGTSSGMGQLFYLPIFAAAVAALAVLKPHVGSQFDREVVEAFISFQTPATDETPPV
jgi:hypothetical protein